MKGNYKSLSLSVRQKICMLVAVMVTSVIPTFAQGFGEQQLLRDGWYFHLGDLKYGGIEFLDHSKWDQITVPHDWSVEQSASPAFASCTGYLPGGIGWYRRNLDIPASKKGERVYVYFGGVYNNSEVFINGKWVGRRPNGYISFMYDLTPYINYGGRNVLAVKVDHSDYADSRWYTGSGIYRDIKMIFAAPVHIDLWGVSYDAKLNNRSAVVHVHTEIINKMDVNATVRIVQSLYDKNEKEVARATTQARVHAATTQKTSQTLRLKNIHRWSLESPYLYVLKTQVYRNGKLVDQTKTTVGLRELTYDSNKGFALNGKWTKLKGVCIHHDAGALGAAVPAEVWKVRMEKLKSIGVNAIRMSHNPQATAVYDACDATGLVVMDEAFDEWEYPKKKWISGWNVGVPGFQGSAHFFREWCERDLADMVRRDRNHPSIIMWSIGNEVDYPNDPYSHPILNDESGTVQIHVRGYKKDHPNADRLGEIATNLVAVVKKYDTSRPTTAALAGAVMSNETTYPGALDIVGYNYTESRYDMDHKKYPKRVLYGSETGDGLSSWKAVRDKEFIFGQFIWTGYDYLGESGRWPSRGLDTGLIEQDDNIKPNGYFRRALWLETPTAYVGTMPSNAPNVERSLYYMPHLWNYTDGEKITVVTYTNADEAELLLNGQTVGERKKYDDATALIRWEVPYHAGKLEVVAYKDGQPVARDAVETTGVPATIDTSIIAPEQIGKHSMLQLPIRVLDAEGRIVEVVQPEITCHVKGAARLVGLESGAKDARLNYRNNHQRAYRGTLKAYVELTKDSGEVEIVFTSPLLKDRKLVYKY